MIKKKGIVLKTFAFTALLITSVVIISFGILLFVMPEYYLNTKMKNLHLSIDKLVEAIEQAKTEDELANLISEFSSDNNAQVIVFDKKDSFLPNLSSPFLSMNLATEKYGMSISGRPLKIAKDSLGNQVIIRKAEDATSLPKIVEKKGDIFRIAIDSNNVSYIESTRKVENQIIGLVDITSTLQPIDEAKTVIISLIPYLLIIDILTALAAAYLYARQLTKPIVQLSRTATKMKTLEPGISCNINTNDEVGELSKNLDSLYESLCVNIKDLKHEMNKVALVEKSKADFMRAASHELKTPITALNGIVEGMIDNVGKYNDRDTYLKESKKLIDHLTKLVSDILKASKFDTVDSILQMENIQLLNIIEKILENNKVFIEEKGLNISVNKMKFQVYTDRVMMENILSNIISNAVRYTEVKGKINIHFFDTTDHIILSIENQCEDMRAEDVQKLFDPFYTRDYSRNRNKSGTGLGLYIVKKNLEILQIPYKVRSTQLGFEFKIYFIKAAQ